MMGKVWRYGDDVNTDVIFAGKYTYQAMEPEEMARHAMEDLDPTFAGSVKKGDIVMGGANFGCGSSREQAATCLKAAGVKAVVAKTFSRIFFRNAINLGLPVIELAHGIDVIAMGDEADIDFEKGVLLHKGQEWKFPPLPPEVMGILEAGGLVPYTKKRLKG